MIIDRAEYSFFKLLSSMSNRVRYRLTTAGKPFYFMVLITAVLSFDIRNSDTYTIASFFFIIALFSTIYSMRYRARFRVTRVLPGSVTAGKEFKYKIIVENLSTKREKDLTIIDIPEDPRPSYDEYVRQKRKLKMFKSSQPVWRVLVQKKELVKGRPMVDIPEIEGRGSREVTVSVNPLRRGKINFTSIHVTRKDPFGLTRGVYNIPLPDSLVVLPKRYNIPAANVSGIRKYQKGGVLMAHSVGDSEEFYALRDYQPGDPPKIIDWKSWAKTDKLVSKKYQEEFFSRQALVIDTFGDESLEAPFEVALSIGSSLVTSMDRQDSLLDVLFVEDRMYCITIGRGVTQKAQVLEMFAGLTLRADRAFSALGENVKGRLPLLNSLICVFLTWDEERAALINDIKKAQIPVRAILINRPGTRHELDPGAEVLVVDTDMPEKSLLRL
jgi:uncharacterized protein (DUF58 family)